MVMAPAAVHRDIAARIELLQKEISLSNPKGQRPPTASTALQRQYKLVNITWRELEDSLQRLSGTRMTVTTSSNGELAQFRLAGPNGVQDVLQVDRRADSVVLQGPSTSVYAWLQVVGAIDQGKGAVSDSGTQIVSLGQADPKKVERALTLVKTVALQQSEEEATGSAVVAPPNAPRGGQNRANGNKPNDPDNPQATAIGGVDSLDSESGLFGDVQIEFVPELGLVIVRGGKRDVSAFWK